MKGRAEFLQAAILLVCRREGRDYALRSEIDALTWWHESTEWFQKALEYAALRHVAVEPTDRPGRQDRKYRLDEIRDPKRVGQYAADIEFRNRLEETDEMLRQGAPYYRFRYGDIHERVCAWFADMAFIKRR